MACLFVVLVMISCTFFLFCTFSVDGVAVEKCTHTQSHSISARLELFGCLREEVSPEIETFFFQVDFFPSAK